MVLHVIVVVCSVPATSDSQCLLHAVTTYTVKLPDFVHTKATTMLVEKQRSVGVDESKTRVQNTLSLSSHVRWQHMVAGVMGGVVSTLVVHPLDLIKIRFQGKTAVFFALLLPRHYVSILPLK